MARDGSGEIHPPHSRTYGPDSLGHASFQADLHDAAHLLAEGRIPTDESGTPSQAALVVGGARPLSLPEFVRKAVEPVVRPSER